MTVVAGWESDTRRYQHLSPAVVVVSYVLLVLVISQPTWTYLIRRTHWSSVLCFEENLWSEVKVCSPAVRIWTSRCRTQDTYIEYFVYILKEIYIFKYSTFCVGFKFFTTQVRNAVFPRMAETFCG